MRAGAISSSFSAMVGSLASSISASEATPTVMPSRSAEAFTLWPGRNYANTASSTLFCEKGPSTMMSSLDAMQSSCSETICAQ